MTSSSKSQPIASLQFLNLKPLEGIFTENLQRAETPSRLTDTSSAAMTDIFLISFNASFHCLTQHIQRFTGVLFRQLSCFDSCTAHGIVCAKDPASHFSRVRQDSCREVVDSHAVSVGRSEQHLNSNAMHTQKSSGLFSNLLPSLESHLICVQGWGAVQNVTEAFGFSEKYWKNLWWLNFRIPDYRSVQSEEIELLFHFRTELQTKHDSYSRGRKHCQSNPALHGHLSTIN